MRLETRDKVTVEATIEDRDDLFRVDRGKLTAEQVRRLVVSDALVDTGATMLSLPRADIERLGVRRYKTKRAKTPVGIFEFGIHDPVRLTVQRRDCAVEVADVFDGGPVLIGQLPLEGLDFVVDPVGQRLIGNSHHNGEPMFDMY